MGPGSHKTARAVAAKLQTACRRLCCEGRMYERALVLWIREQSAYCQDLNSNSGGGGATPKNVATCGGSAWFTGGPTEVVAKAVWARAAARSKRAPVRAACPSAALLAPVQQSVQHWGGGVGGHIYIKKKDANLAKNRRLS
jgi:hypothetical protein